MDYVWNRTSAEQVRAECVAAMQRQVDNMLSTAGSYESIAYGLDLRASAQEEIARTARRTEWETDSEGVRQSRTVPDTARRSEASGRATALREQSSALCKTAADVRQASRELEDAIKETNKTFLQLYESAQESDLHHTGQMNLISSEIGAYVQWLEQIRDSIGDGALNLADPGVGSAAEILGIDGLLAQGIAGYTPYAAFGGDPVNMSTGNFVYSKEDITAGGRYPVAFKRIYNTIGGTDGVLGKGWTHNYNIRLSEEKEGVHITLDDGRLEIYEKLTEEEYVPPLSSDKVLLKLGGGWGLVSRDMKRYEFDSEGQLRSITDANGNAAELTYTDGLLKHVTAASGSLSFAYDKSKRITSVTDGTGRKAVYEYTGNKLAKATLANGAEYGYGYDKAGNLSKVVNPQGIEAIRNEYDAKGRMVKQSYANGGAYELEYKGNTTAATQQNGNRIKYERDGKYRTTRIIYADSEERNEYNICNNRTKHIDRNGNTRKYEYDLLGNLIEAKQFAELGEAKDINGQNMPLRVTKYERDELSQVERVTDALGNTEEYTYDGWGNVICKLDKDGFLTQYAYNNGFEHQKQGQFRATKDHARIIRNEAI